MSTYLVQFDDDGWWIYRMVEGDRLVGPYARREQAASSARWLSSVRGSDEASERRAVETAQAVLDMVGHAE